MTREEAITALGDRNNLLWGMSKEEQKYYSEALDMAISALSDGELTNEKAIAFLQDNGWLVEHDRIMASGSAEGEYIKKEELLKANREYWEDVIGIDESGSYIADENERWVFNGLQSYSFLEREKGTWFDRGSLSCRCSACGCKNDKEESICPNCKTEMEISGNEDEVMSLPVYRIPDSDESNGGWYPITYRPITEDELKDYEGWVDYLHTEETMILNCHTSGAEFLEEVGGDIGSSCEKFIKQMTGNEGGRGAKR